MTDLFFSYENSGYVYSSNYKIEYRPGGCFIYWRHFTTLSYI